MEVVTKNNMGRLRPLILTFCLLAAALCAALSLKQGITTIGLFLLCVMGGVFTTVFLTTKQEIYMILGGSGAVFILQFVGSLSASLMGMTVLIAAFVLAYHVRHRKPKTTALLMMSIILSVGFLLIAAVLYAVRGGSLAPSELLEKYNDVFRALEIECAARVHEMIDALDPQLLALYEKSNITKEMLTEVYLGNMEAVLDTIQLTLPGILILLIQLIAYIEIAVFRIAARICRVDALLPAPHWHIYPTQVSCIVYLVVSVLYMLATFFSSADSVFLISMTNMWLVLLPTMLFCGTHVLLLRLRHPLYRMGTGIILTIFVFGIFFLPSVAIQLALFTLSFLGAQTVCTHRMIEAEKQKKE